MKKIEFFDTCLQVGRKRAPDPIGNYITLENLNQYLLKFNIKKALIEHAVSVEGSPYLGYKILKDKIKNYENFYLVYNFMPAVSNSIEKIVTLNDLKDTKIIAGRIDAYDFCNGEGDKAMFSPILKLCNKLRLPLFIDFRKQGSFMNFDLTICEKYPKIPFIFENIGHYPFHKAFWALKNLKNFYISTVGFSVFNGIKFLKEEIGINKIIFGSNYPAQYIGISLGTVLFANISFEEKEQIARKNFENLIKKIKR